MSELRKYPRTRHILDSRLQPGDEDDGTAPFDAVAGRHLVVEEKVDGANAAISFDPHGRLMLQSRGHYLTGGPRERHFDLFKQWAHGVSDMIRPLLQDRYIVYGEWLYAKHTIFYDALPHYFLEFDVLDRHDETFLSTPARRRLLAGSPFCSVPVLHEDAVASAAELKALVGRSAFKSTRWRERLADSAQSPEHRADLVAQQTDPSDLMEGLYVKVEQDGRVTDRLKYVRPDFLAAVLDSESHWQSRPILPNRLASGAALAWSP
jgi:RNA ligase-like protein